MSRTFMVHSSQVEAWDEIKALDASYKAAEARSQKLREEEMVRNYFWIAVASIILFGLLCTA